MAARKSQLILNISTKKLYSSYVSAARECGKPDSSATTLRKALEGDGYCFNCRWMIIEEGSTVNEIQEIVREIYGTV